MLPTTRHRCNVISELCCPGAKTAKMGHVTRYALRRSTPRPSIIKSRFFTSPAWFSVYQTLVLNSFDRVYHATQLVNRFQAIRLFGRSAGNFPEQDSSSCFAAPELYHKKHSLIYCIIISILKKIEFSLYSRYYAEACNEWRGPSPRLSA